MNYMVIHSISIMKQAIVILIYVISLYMWQLQNRDSVVDTLFKHSISLGILMLVLVMLYREWKTLRSYSQQQDQTILRITEESTREIEKSSNRIDRLSKKVELLIEKIEDLDK